MNNLQARNELVIGAPAAAIWRLITDIHSLHKVNPGIVKASGSMNTLGDTRTCELDNNGRKGTIIEKLIELIPLKKTVWTVVSDTMGMSKMMSDTRFVFNLETLKDGRTRVTSETYYKPANVMARIMNGIMMKRMISKAQEKILSNLKDLTEVRHNSTE